MTHSVRSMGRGVPLEKSLPAPQAEVAANTPFKTDSWPKGHLITWATVALAFADIKALLSIGQSQQTGTVEARVLF
jgi:hypothetical protein